MGIIRGKDLKTTNSKETGKKTQKSVNNKQLFLNDIAKGVNLKKVDKSEKRSPAQKRSSGNFNIDILRKAAAQRRKKIDDDSDDGSDDGSDDWMDGGADSNDYEFILDEYLKMKKITLEENEKFNSLLEINNYKRELKKIFL